VDHDLNRIIENYQYLAGDLPAAIDQALQLAREQLRKFPNQTQPETKTIEGQLDGGRATPTCRNAGGGDESGGRRQSGFRSDRCRRTNVISKRQQYRSE
jgi:hypothetical protein